MSVPAIIDTDAFDFIQQVGDLHTKGTTSPFTIARRLGVKVVEVRPALEAWKEILRSDVGSQEAAKDALDDMLHRYDTLIERANRNLEDLETLDYDEKVANQINSTVKLIGELDAKRVDLLQKSGLLESSDLGDELAMREEREAAIIDILRNQLCPKCKDTVKIALGRLTGHVEGVVVDE